MRSLPFVAAVIAGVLAASSAGAQPNPYEGLRKTVAVDTFHVTEGLGASVTADGLTAMLTEALAKDGRFVVVERPGLGAVQAEQQLGQSGATTAETGARTGQLLGASAIIRAAVTKYEANAGGNNLSVSGLPMGRMLGGRAGVKSQKAVMEISLRLIDTSTGQVISTSKAQGTASSSAADVSVVNNWSDAAVSAGTFRNTPIGKAGEDAIAKGVEQIAAGMRNVPWSAQVIEASGETVYVSAGADRNVQPGLQLGVFRKGKVLTDPSTGEVLDVEMQKIAAIRVDAVREKLSTAVLVSGSAPARGDLLRPE